MNTLPAQQQPSKIFARFGERYGVDGSKVSTLLKATAFRTKDGVVTDEQMAALLIVAEQFKLNPFLKEIYAFPDKQNGIVPVIGVDGWTKIANEHPYFDGIEFRYSENIVQIDAHSKPCPEWVECVVYRKDRTRPTIVREYLEECYREPYKGRDGYVGNGPWQSHTKRFMRHKALVQGVRMALGFAGVYDDDEAERIAEARVVEASANMASPIDVLPSQSPLALPVGEQFDELIIKLGFGDQRELVEQYVQVCSTHFKVDRDSVLAQVLQRPDEFSKTFPAWARSSTTKPAAQPAPATPPTRTRRTAKDAKAPEERVNAETGEVLDAEPPQDDQTEEPPVDNSNKVACPNKSNKLIDDWECAGCKSRNGCPAWSE